MERWGYVIPVTLVVLYLVGGNCLARRAMKYYKGPRNLIWLDVPLDDPELYSDQGKRAIRVLHLYYMIAGFALIAGTIGFEWLSSGREHRRGGLNQLPRAVGISDGPREGLLAQPLTFRT